jgi:hypothetical protein
MWLITMLFFSIATSLIYLLFPNFRKYKTDYLALMFWGSTIMIFSDKATAFLEGEAFLEETTEGIITNSFMLGIAMSMAVILAWFLIFFAIPKINTIKSDS